MSRRKKDPSKLRQMCERLRLLVEKHLKLDMVHLSKQLGYSNPTTLRKIWKGEAFPDTERLAILATIKTISGSVPNIHWLITGCGEPLISDTKNYVDKDLQRKIEQLPSIKRNALHDFLDLWDQDQ